MVQILLIEDDATIAAGLAYSLAVSYTHLVIHLGSTTARLKLKGIDGGPHKQWSMWFNSKQREEPYLGLTSLESSRDT